MFRWYKKHKLKLFFLPPLEIDLRLEVELTVFCVNQRVIYHQLSHSKSEKIPELINVRQ